MTTPEELAPRQPRWMEYRNIDELKPHPKNDELKGHADADLDASMEEFGYTEAVLIDERTGLLSAGHGRWLRVLAARAEGREPPEGVVVEDGAWLLPVQRGWSSTDDLQAEAYLIASNRLVEKGGWIEEGRNAILADLAQHDRLAGTGYSPEEFEALLAAAAAARGGEKPEGAPAGPTLADRFLIPPFSVFDARQGYWQDRKRAWLSIGIRSEQGRPENLLKMSDTVLKVDRPNRSTPAPAAAVIVERAAAIEPGGELWQRIRANLRDACKEAGWNARRLDETFGFNGMGGHWLGESQPILPTPDQWAQLAEHLPLDPELFDVMTRTAERPGAPSSDLIVAGGRKLKAASDADPAYAWKKQEAEKRVGRSLSDAEFEADHYEADAYVGGTSIFDPVLCEIAYRWWCPAGGLVLDPFAGGSVRGVVAAMLDRSYVGIDLSAAQVAANEAQADAILEPRAKRAGARWLQGDSAAVLPELGEPADLLFSCPPYYDLEQYGDDPADLSNLGDYEAFIKAYREIIRLAVERLAPNRFACFVVGDIRSPGGAYRGFVADTIAAFEDAGCAFYNDIVLVTAVGSLALRAARIFGGARKVGKAHQNVLVFVKGDPKAAAEACAPVDPADVAELFGSVIVEESAGA